MKILRWLLPLLCASAFAQTPGFNYYVPANGVQVNTGLSAANTAATYQNIAGLWDDGSCTGVVAILLNGTCSTIGTGSVTGVSVVTANGLSGTVSNPTVNAAITLATTFTGIGYSNGTGFAAAVAGNFPTLNQSTSGNAATATAFAAAPSGCSGSTFVTGISANGTPTCATPAGGGNVSNSGTPTSGQFAEWNSPTTILGETMGGDCTLATATITCTKTNGTAFGTFATQSYATPPAIGGTTPAAGTFSTLAATGALTTDVTGSTQCLQANSSGVVSGTGNSCGGSGSTGANPTASVGLTAVNGTATTFLRSDGAPALSQAISPTMSGQWNFTTNTGNLLISPTSTWAEGWHLADAQSGGHQYGDISGYCNGAAPGTWGIYDYTIGVSRLCMGASGNWTVEAPSSGIAWNILGNAEIQVSNGTDATFNVTTNSTRNIILEENDTGSTSPSGMPANSSGLSSSTGAIFLHSAAGSVVTDSAFTANVVSGVNTAIVAANDSGVDEVCMIVNRSGANACNTFPNGQQGIGTVSGTLFLHSGNATIATDATNVPWPASSSGSGSISPSTGCATGSASTYTYQIVGNVATVTFGPSGSLTECAPSIITTLAFGNLTTALRPATTHTVMAAMFTGSQNTWAQCNISTGGLVSCVYNTSWSSPNSGFVASSTIVYPLN